MNEFDINDLAVITGPLSISDGSITVPLHPGEVVSILHLIDKDGDYFVLGHESNFKHWISGESLTPLAEVQADDTVEWGDPADPDYVDYSGIHDYVWADE